MNTKRRKKIFIFFLIIIAVGAGVFLALEKPSSYLSNLVKEEKSSLPIQEEKSLRGGFNGSKEVKEEETGGENIEPAFLFEEKQKRNFVTLTNVPVSGFWVASQPKEEGSQNQLLLSDIFYLNEKGEIFKLKEPNQAESIASSSFGRPLRVIQNNQGDRVAVQFDSGTVALFDVKAKSWQELGGKEITDISFSPDGKKVAFLKEEIKESDVKTSIFIKDLSSSKQPLTLVASLKIVDFNLLWPENNSLFLLPKPSYFFRGQAWKVDLKSKTITWLTAGNGYSLLFSSLANLGLQFTSAEKKSEMSVTVVDSNLKKLADLSFSTFKEKCAFSSSEKEVAYCAVPYFANKTSDLTLPDDFYKKGVYFKDRIYKIDLKNSVVESIFNLEDVSLDAIYLKEKNQQLFFINRYDDKLYLYDFSEKVSE
ncbi:MAG: hypothetical protein N2Z68_02110 [Patescibacteria group bacterium]|nr:hypothetical protein [Patescibacteria group bacterium]